MCEFLEYDGADYRHLPPNGGVDDLVAMWKVKPGRAHACRPGPRDRSARRSASPRDRAGELGWAGGRPGVDGAIRARCLPSHPVLQRHLQLLQLQPRAVRRIAEGAVRRCARRRDPGRSPTTRLLRRRHDLLRWRDAVAARTGRSGAAHRCLPGAVRPAPEAEITLETNPETSTARAGGVSRGRASIASASACSRSRAGARRLGRLHTADRARRAVAEARAAGFVNISLDLMMWLPGQSLGDWLRERRRADRAGARARLAVPARAVPERAPQRGHGAGPGWSQAPDDDAAEYVPVGAGAARSRAGYRSTRSRTWRGRARDRGTT
jgi:hypothetical protein